MLQRAASNAYSWWVAGHIRTKQSKWLEQSLQDMEEKVSAVVKLISEDGDSFAKRAEMYYKKRPELLNFVEESFRAYRALAERYDHISKELQNANNTLASAFPDQFQFIMDEDDDEEEFMASRMPRKGIGYPKQSSNVPSVPKHFPTKNIKAIIALASKANNNNNNSQGPKKDGRRPGNKAVEALRSRFSKAQAVEEIDKLQKTILTKQTEKEFTKSSYESRVAKYMEIEKEITEMQEKVSTLQEEFGIGKAIEDSEARTLMLEAALKSCQDALAELQEKQAKSDEEAKQERLRIKSAQDKILSLKGEFDVPGGDDDDQPKPSTASGEGGEEQWGGFDDGANTTSQAKEIEMLRDKMKQHFEGDSSLTMSAMVEKIDELVNKVICMESAVSSQTAMINRMRVESDQLQTHIRILEDDKANLIQGKDTLSDKLKEMDLKLKEIQDLDHRVEIRKNSLQTQFIEASSNIDVISQKLPDLELDEEEIEESKGKQDEAVAEEKDGHGKASTPNSLPVDYQDSVKFEESGETSTAPPMGGDVLIIQQEEHGSSKQSENTMNGSQASKMEMAMQGEHERNWEKEYTSVLHNYQEVEKRLHEVENKSVDSLTELREMENLIAKKDQEIQSLQQRLIILQKKLEEYNNMKETNEEHCCHDKDELIIRLIKVEEQREMSPAEAKLRGEIDAILEENLDFWMRFSSSFAKIQKFHSQVEDLHKDLAKVEENKKKREVSNETSTSVKSDTRAIYKHLKEIQTELTVWLEQSMTLRGELQRRFTQLCNVQEEISKALNDGAIDDRMQFTSLQAAKFQGEVLNMQQENNRVADELQSSLDNVTSLQIEIEKTISRLNEELGISASKSQPNPQCRQTGSKNQVPLRSFIFGVKPKKQKQSLFSCVHPAFHRKY